MAQLRARFAGSQADRNATAATAASSSSSSTAPAAGGKGGKGGAAAKAAGGKDGAKDGGAKEAKNGGKQEKGAAAGGKGGGKEPERPADISRIDLRVGVINKAWRHPDAERRVREGGRWGCSGAGEQAGLRGGAQGAPVAQAGCAHPCPPACYAPCSLYVEEVDVGEGAPRTVVSGLVKFIPEAGACPCFCPPACGD